MTRRAFAVIAAAAAAAALLCGCEKIDRNMWDNPAFKAQEEPVRLPPEGSVPTKGVVRTPSLSESSSLRNPVPADNAAIAAGKELFLVHCSPCHGDSARGDGPVGKKFIPTPMDLRATAPAGALPDGVLFGMISNGIGGMPPFAADISPAERWKIIRYLRTLR